MNKTAVSSRSVLIKAVGLVLIAALIVGAVFVVGLLVGILLPKLMDNGSQQQPVQSAPIVVTAPAPQAAPSTSAGSPYIDYGDMPTQNMGRWPETSFYLLSQSDLIGLNLMELELMRNEIYARHGYIFKLDRLRRHFANEPWYRGYTTDAKVVAADFNDIEKKNIQIIKDYEDFLNGK